MIARTAVPAIETRLRTKLYHAKGYCGTWIGVTVGSGANERIDIIDGRLFWSTGCQNHGQRKG